MHEPRNFGRGGGQCRPTFDHDYFARKMYLNNLRLISVLDSVGIDLKELGGQLPKCLKFCPGTEIYSRFSLKLSLCRHKLGVQPPTPDNSNPGSRTYMLGNLCIFLQITGFLSSVSNHRESSWRFSHHRSSEEISLSRSILVAASSVYRFLCLHSCSSTSQAFHRHAARIPRRRTWTQTFNCVVFIV